MNRRKVLKQLAAAAGVAFVPTLSFTFPAANEPEWVVEYQNYDETLAVAARWGRAPDYVLQAIEVPAPLKEDEKMVVAYCKQTLRKWYAEHSVRRTA